MMQVELTLLGFKCILLLVLNSLLCLTQLGRSCLSGKEMQQISWETADFFRSHIHLILQYAISKLVRQMGNLKSLETLETVALRLVRTS